jgi:hypothetical protein
MELNFREYYSDNYGGGYGHGGGQRERLPAVFAATQWLHPKQAWAQTFPAQPTTATHDFYRGPDGRVHATEKHPSEEGEIDDAEAERRNNDPNWHTWYWRDAKGKQHSAKKQAGRQYGRSGGYDRGHGYGGAVAPFGLPGYGGALQHWAPRQPAGGYGRGGYSQYGSQGH